jgi:DeoR/GlpR family transcriptional regulator of sugar metabolism
MAKKQLEADSLQREEIEQMERGPYIKAKKDQQNTSKDKIAEYIASNLVKNFDAVLLDAGSTAEVIAQKLFTRRKFLTVMTNNMGAYVSYTQAVAARDKGTSALVASLVAGLLNENELILTGGRFDVTYEALFGDATLKAIEGFSPNVTIIGVSGLLFNGGVFCHGSEEVRLKKMLWTIQTDTRVIASDWTKIGKRDAFAFGPNVSELKVGAGRAIIVTSQPPRDADEKLRKQFDDEIQLIKNHGIQIVMADKEIA